MIFVPWKPARTRTPLAPDATSRSPFGVATVKIWSVSSSCRSRSGSWAARCAFTPTARLALQISGVKSADELSMTAASVGLASNLSALRALATEGIQRGHMSLHARSVASAAGARGDEVELVAARIAGAGLITVEAAERALVELRATP